MAFSENASELVISTKRRLDDADDHKLDEFRKPKTVMRKYPPTKIRIGAEAIRDFPPGCGILLQNEMVKPFEDKKLSFKPNELGFNRPSVGGIIQEKKPLKNLDNVDSKSKSKSMECESHSFENNKLTRFKPKEIGIKINNKPFGSRLTGKVKYWDPTSENDDNAHGSKARDSNHTINTIGSRNEQIRREKIREVMILFDTVYTQLFQENGSKYKGEKKANWSLPAEAEKIVKQKLNLMNAHKTLGQIRGVQPGDMFKFRSQLYLLGLHCQPHCGIDYTNINGKNVAISIVDSRRYSNKSQSCDVLTYSGQGGGGVGLYGSSRQVAPGDQKLERGNLALKNSMNEKNPVRVIRKVFGVGMKNNDVFVYDGLYTVKHCTQKRGSEGKMVFMFDLHKMPDQPHLQKRVNGIPGDVVLYQHSTFQML